MLSFTSTFFAFAAAITAVSAQSAGCGQTAPQGGYRSVNVNGLNREYTLHIPSNYDSSTPYRLVVGYHWLSGSMQNVVDGGYYGLEPLSEGSTIFIAPQGIDAGWANDGGRDIAFTDAFIDTALSELCIDESQIFATGFSYGGGMSFAVACARPGEFLFSIHVMAILMK